MSELDVSATRIADTGLKQLTRLRKLRTHWLSRNQISDEALSKLRHSLPGLQISLRDDLFWHCYRLWRA